MKNQIEMCAGSFNRVLPLTWWLISSLAQKSGANLPLNRLAPIPPSSTPPDLILRPESPPPIDLVHHSIVMSNKPDKPTTQRQCSNKQCTNEGSKTCSRCKSARYCSQQCQKVHWKAIHKRECTSPDSESESENDHITPDRVVEMDGVTIVRMTGAQMMRLSKGLEIREFWSRIQHYAWLSARLWQ